MPKLTDDKHAKRAANILDSAEICFARSGFHRTTMQDICRQAGVSAGALYVYFDSKEALIEGIVARDREEIACLLQTLGEQQDFFGAMEQALMTCVVERPAHKVALFVEIVAEAHRNARVAQTLNGCDTLLRRMLTELVARARGEGRIPPGIPADQLAMVMAMLGDAMFIRRVMSPDFNGAAVAPLILDMMRQLMTGGAAPAALAPTLPDRNLTGAVQ